MLADTRCSVCRGLGAVARSSVSRRLRHRHTDYTPRALLNAGHQPLRNPRVIRRAFEIAGIEFIDENGGARVSGSASVVGQKVKVDCKPLEMADYLISASSLQ